MRVIRHIRQMQQLSSRLKRQGKTIGLVPTMGALHEGHISLIRKARKENDCVAVSIFVNPLQFGPQEDYQRYPRPVKQDLALCRREKVDFVFHPEPSEMYPDGFKTHIEVLDLGDVLCGESRPGHFKGVATVVAKLFNAVLPATAYFGQKDCQQAVILHRMAKDLNFPVEIKVLPIVREHGGLALSSRNTYLSAEEKEEAHILSQALSAGRAMVAKGVRDARVFAGKLKTLIQSKHSAKVDYVAVVDLHTLRPVKTIKGDCLVALAVWFGKTRLIDNTVIKDIT